MRAGAHITTVGPKTAAAHETPDDLATRAAVLASDSPAQAAAYEEPFFTDREPTHLGGILCGELEGRTGDSDITLYASTGLAGSEIVTASALLDRLSSRPTGGSGSPSGDTTSGWEAVGSDT